jgi:leader peptidase (prepilin peptidase)/N-methyltransferase
MIFTVALLGLAVGAAINWLADDLPTALRLGRPHYPDGTLRSPWAWSGLMAFVGGYRLSPTGTSRLSWRYPLTEIATAGLFGYTVVLEPFTAVKAIYWWSLIAILVLITVIDLEHREILIITIVIGSVIALLGALVAGPSIAPSVTFADYLLGGLLGFGIFTLLYWGGRLFSSIMAEARGEALDEVAFGYGDVLLATLSGFILGWQALIFAIFIAVLAGGAGALLFLGFRLLIKGDYEWFTALPYGQYIVFGTLIMMLWRVQIANVLLRR